MTAAQPPAARLAYLSLIREVEDLLYFEADLLDERRYEEWLALFTEDAHYWMPIRKNVAFEDRDKEMTDENDISWFNDDKITLAKRVKQLQTGIHWADEPISRVAHLITNIRLPEPMTELEDGRTARVTSRFFVYRNRLDTETDILVGRRNDMVRREGGALKIAKRKIIIDQSVLMAKNLTMFF